MNPAHKIFAVSTVALGAQSFQAMAAVVNYELPTQVTASSGPFSIFVPVAPEILDADAFLAIDEGSVHGAEGATFSVVAKFTDEADVLIYQKAFPGSGSTFSFSSISSTSFTAGTLSGLQFIGQGGFMNGFNLPAGTTFSFNSVAIPEPASATFFAGAVIAGVYATRRRRETKLVA